MTLPPILPRGELHRRSRRTAMLEQLTNDPGMDNIRLAQILGCDIAFIRNMRKSDTFQADLTKSIQDKYGETLSKVGQTVLDAQITALERMKRTLGDDAVPTVVLNQTAEIVLDHTIKYAGLMNKSAQPSDTPPPAAVSLTINIDTLDRARQIAKDYSKEIILEPSDVSHAKPLQVQEHSYLTARGKERDEV